MIDQAYRDRFWARVDRSGDCWVWTGYKSKGYGRFGSEGKRLAAHRVAYELLVGPIPAGLTIDHLCRNRACVNPDHLEPVTMKVNLLRGEHPSAQAVRTNRCKQGHEFTEENTYVYYGNHRKCKACAVVRRKVRYATTGQ